MALMGLLVMLELALYAGCFCCGIVTAVSVTIVQVSPLRNPRAGLKTSISSLFRVLPLFSVRACYKSVGSRRGENRFRCCICAITNIYSERLILQLFPLFESFVSLHEH